MDSRPDTRGQKRSAYAGLDFIKAAFCPLKFTAKKLRDHPEYAQLRGDKAIGQLEVGNELRYPRQFSFTDQHGNRKHGTQIITAPFGFPPQPTIGTTTGQFTCQLDAEFSRTIAHAASQHILDHCMKELGDAA